MPSIIKLELTVTSAYAAAPDPSPGGLSSETWGAITLWDIRFWGPWDSRGLIGPTGWQGYLQRAGVMDSPQAPGYDTVTQSPKSWPKETRTVLLYDVDRPISPYTPPSSQGVSSPSSVYIGTVLEGGGLVTDASVAFDVTTVESLAETLVIAVYGFNSYSTTLGGPTGTDALSFYGIHLDVELDTGATTRFYPTATAEIAPGTGVGSPTGVANPSNAIDDDRLNTAAVVQETNGPGGFGPLWHPAVFLLEGWSWGTVLCGDPPDGQVGTFYSHTFPVEGGTAPFVFAVTVGSLPPGLTLDTATGVVSGVPTVFGNYSFTMSVAESSGIVVVVSCSIEIEPLPDPHYLLDLWVWRQLTEFSSVSQEISFPPGYERAMRLQLASEFGRAYPGRDLARIKQQLAQAIEAVDKANVTHAQAVEDLPPSE